MLRGLLVAVLTLALVATASASTGVIEAIETSPIVVVAEVERVTSLAHAGYQAVLKVTRSLRGGQEFSSSLTIAWEEPVPSLSPRFKAGGRVLVAAGPLSSASIWKIRVPDDAARGALFEVAAGGAGYLLRPGAGELDVVEHYLAVAAAARKGDAGALGLARLCAIGQPRLANDAAARLTRFDDLSDHLTPGAARAIVAALLRAEMAETASLLLEMIAAQRPAMLREAIEEQIRATPEPVPSILYSALGAVDDGLSGAVTETLLESESPAARETAARHASGPAAGDLLRGLMRNDRAPAVRAAAVTRLARLDGVAALSDVIRALEDPAASVRLAAAQASAGFGPPAVEALRRTAIHDPSDAARAAIAALSLMGRQAHVALLEIATEHPNEGMRTLAEIALGQPIGDRH